MEFKGKIQKVFPIQEGTSQNGNHWRKVDFVFEYREHENDRWTDKVLLSALNDRIEQYDLHEGDDVVIGFYHNVSEYNGRSYNEVRVYKFEKISKDAPQTEEEPVKPAETSEVTVDESDDLPF